MRRELFQLSLPFLSQSKNANLLCPLFHRFLFAFRVPVFQDHRKIPGPGPESTLVFISGVPVAFFVDQKAVPRFESSTAMPLGSTPGRQ